MLKFEDYLADFTNTINMGDFLVNLLVAALLGLALKAFYIKFGTSVSNRHKFASVFVPLVLTTLLVITVVKASIALSLGLVGALSIVRFRAAIKEPEELTYLFMAIGIGLVAGAGKPLLAIVAMAIIFPLLYSNYAFRHKDGKHRNNMYIHLRSTILDLQTATSIIEAQADFLELKRFDSDANGNFFSYVIQAKGLDALSKIKQEIKQVDQDAELSIIDQPDLIL